MVAGGMEEAGAGEGPDIGELVIIRIIGAAILIGAGVAVGAGVVAGAAAIGVVAGGADGEVAGTVAVAGTGASLIDQRNL
jgi:hypothetical protein